MIQRPPRSTLFPTRRSSDLPDSLQNLLGDLHRFGIEEERARPREVVKVQRVAVVDLEAEGIGGRSEEHTSELQSQSNLVCRLLLEKKKIKAKLKNIVPMKA